LLAATFLSLSNAYAATNIKDIQVVGNQRIESSTIISNIGVEVGESADQEELDRAVKKLFATGYFADVNARFEGSSLIIAVVENPVINKVSFEGNDDIEDKILNEITTIRPRQVYTLTKVKQETKTLYEVYRLKGFFGAKITPKIIRRDQNRVDIVFEIEEGEPTKVERIIFVGNKVYGHSKLEETIMTKENRWYRFFATSNTYDPDRMAYDQELLRKFYLSQGYADFQVKSAVAELTPDQKEFYVTFTLDEGERYRFGKIDITTKVEKLDVSRLLGDLTMSEGDWYSSTQVDRTIETLTHELGNMGYAFVEVVPRIEKDAKTKVININFEIFEGPRVYIDRITIDGNLRTDEDVIRRELLLFEGDAYNAHFIKQSERRLYALGFFKKVDIKQEPSDSPDKVNLRISVDEEESTGELWLAGGYSTLDGPIGDVGIRERNFIGRGQDVMAKFTLAQKRQQFDFGFTEPYFLDRRLRAGFDVFSMQSKGRFNSMFEHERIGFNLRLGYNLTEYLTQQLMYTLRTDRIKDLSPGRSVFIRAQQGNATTSMVSQTLLYDRRDNPRTPTSGYYLGLTNSFAGVGGNVRYLKNDVFVGHFTPIADDIVLGISGSAGVMGGLGKNIRTVDRYSMGEIGSLRGFRSSGAEPREIISGDSLGGRKYYQGSIEGEFPIGLPNELGVKGALFADIGAAWDAEEKGPTVRDTAAPRASVGAGLSWRSPVGPLRIDFAQAVKKENFDREKTIHFGVTQRF
jgi:outer membrane protein insertion porin family